MFIERSFRLIKLVTFAFLIFYVQTIFALNNSITSDINQILQAYGNNANIGVVVQSVDTGKILYEQNANQLFTPASTMKLYTATAALQYLGPGYQYKTDLLTDASNELEGTLNGDLYLRFTGDPLLTTADLQSLLMPLTQAGIHTIQGNIIIDNLAMDTVNWGPGWTWDDQNYCYSAPATATVLNSNCFNLNITPSSQLNAPAVANVTNTLANIQISNETITDSAPVWSCPLDLHKTSFNNTYDLSGCVTPNHPMSLQVSVSNSEQAMADTIIELLRQQNISVTGNLTIGKTPANARLIARHASQPMSFLVTKMLKNSDDLIANVLFKTIGGVYYNTTGTWLNAAQAEKMILAPISGIDFSKLVIADGAGLSRYDLVSPLQLMHLLDYDDESLSAKNIFYSALPVSGTDGTLQYRLGGPIQGKVHAKTGTMNSTSGLAGFVQTKNQQNLVFVILVNGFIGNQDSYHDLEDKICTYLANSSV